MDLRLYARVLWRFKIIVAIGFVVAVALAYESVAGKKTLYESQSTLLITQPGFPWGAAIPKYETHENQPPVLVGDPSRMTSLTNLYVAFANSDPVKQLLIQRFGSRGKIVAAASFTTLPTGYVIPLPMLTITGTDASPATAVRTTANGVKAFQLYLTEQQQSASIKPSDRVEVAPVKAAGPPVAVSGGKKTLPIVVFAVVIMAVIGLAFLLENIRPRSEPVPEAGEASEAEQSSVAASAEPARRSA